MSWILDKCGIDNRGVSLPIINTECNFNAQFAQGTDPRIQQMSGCVWLALVVRKAILNGLASLMYFQFGSNKSWELRAKPSGGWGFGMTDSVTRTTWLPYLFWYMMGTNLSIGDDVLDSSTNTDDVKSLAWKNGDNLNLLLISKVNQPITVQIVGNIRNYSYLKLDKATPVDNPQIQTGTVSSDNIGMTGYTVMLLQAPLTAIVSIRSFPIETDVHFDNQDVGSTPIDVKVQTGTHTATAEAIHGNYNFLRWENEINLTRTLDVSSDISITVIYAISTKRLTFQSNIDVQATVATPVENVVIAILNQGQFCDIPEGTEIQVTIPKTTGNYTFQKWNDQTTDNPKIFVLSTDTILEAYYSTPPLPIVQPIFPAWLLPVLIGVGVSAGVIYIITKKR